MPHGKHYKQDRRGFRPTGSGTKKPCPHCGKAISHGLPGNPHLRARQPCEQATPDRALNTITRST